MESQVIFTEDWVFENRNNRAYRYPLVHSINRGQGFHEESWPIKSYETFESVVSKMLKVQEGIKAEKEILASFKGLSIEQVMSHPKYSHSRSRSYGVTFYAYSSYSPTGVMAVGGCSNDELNKVSKCLSPTEKR